MLLKVLVRCNAMTCIIHHRFINVFESHNMAHISKLKNKTYKHMCTKETQNTQRTTTKTKF